MQRYVVTELRGFMNTGRSGAPGLSCMVIDTAWNHRVMATYRSEDRMGFGWGKGSTTIGRVIARDRADAHAARLNAAYSEDVSPARGTEA